MFRITLLLIFSLFLIQIPVEGKRIRTVNFRDLKVRFNDFYLKGENFPFTGRAIIKHKNQKLLLEIFFKNGKFHGSVRTFYKNGKLKDEAVWKNGNVVKITKTSNQDSKAP
ncbi:hypothetical protein ACFL35_17670 [Candidatus Riflebacteria bacterium]